MATTVEINAIADIILEVFSKDPEVFRTAMQEIKDNTAKVTLENKIAVIDAEIKAFIEQKEAEKQVLLGLK